MNDPIRRAITLRRSCAKRNPDDLTATAPAKHAYSRGRHYVRLETIGDPEADQDTRRIRGELDSGAGLFEPFGLFENKRAKPIARQRQRRG